MERHIRMAALQCNFHTVEETLDMPRRWVGMGFDTEQLLHTHADLFSAVYDEKRHGELVAEYLQRSKARNLRTVVYMNCHILGPTLADRYQEWGLQNPDGSWPKFYGSYYGCCLNSGWLEYFYQGLEHLARYEIEGLFFDGPLYVKCACRHCRDRFEKQYGKSYAGSNDEERETFAYESVIAFKDALYRKVKSINPGWMMYFNEGLFAGRSNAKNMVRQLASDDWVGTEGGFFFYGPPKDEPYWTCSSSAKLAEAVAGSGRLPGGHRVGVIPETGTQPRQAFQVTDSG